MSGEEEGNCNRHQRVGLRTALTAGRWRNTQEDPIWDFEREDRETIIWIFQWVM
jgi:hypothetical protein